MSEAENALDKARQAERDARKAVAAVARQLQALTTREADARRAFDAARDTVAALGPPPAERRDLAEDWAHLVAWGRARSPALSEQMAEHTRAAEAARGDAAALVETLAAAAREAGVDPGRAGSWPGEAVAAAHARAEEAVARIDEQLARAEQLRTEQRDATTQQQVAESLAGHLAANRFE